MAVATPVSSSLATVGDWVLVRKVGEGATSTVYLAKGVGGRQAALKVFSEGDRSDPNDLPLIVTLDRRWGPAWLDAASGPPAFIATEWVEGEPVSGGSPREVWAVVHAVARALAELHEAGVRHGDVKPANILWHGRVPTHDVPEERAATLIDLGLATHLGEQARGGTPAYAAPELRRGDDVGPRADVFALGVMVRELARGDAALLQLADVMSAPAAGARPSAAWVADRASRALGLATDPAEAARARVATLKRTYIALRAPEIARASEVDAAVTGPPRAWLEGAINAIRKVSGRDVSGAVVRSSALVRARWMTALVGASAAGWPVVEDSEAELAARLRALAETTPFVAWTWADVRGVARATAEDVPLADADDAATALALARPHPPESIVAAVERRGDLPEVLRGMLADALARRGETARALLALEGSRAHAGLRAELARRSGLLERAREEATAILADEAQPPSTRDRAAAVLARIAWDAGRDDEAERLLAGRAGPAVAEVDALLHARRGSFDAAIARVDGALVGEEDAITLARLHGTRGWAEHASGDAAAAFADYHRAVDLASRAGAIADEASYLVGEAAAATDAGDVARALASATRAALLLDRLGRPREASRAWLVRAAALSTVGDLHGADETVSVIVSRDACDARTRAYARWARVERRPPGDAVARDEAVAAMSELGTTGDDALRAAARALVWAPDKVTPERVAELDRAASAASPVAAWEWFGARVRSSASREAFARLLSLAATPAPVATRGPALAAGRDLAMRLGEGEAARRFETLRRAAADRLRETTPPELKEALASVEWMQDGPVPDASGLEPSQIAQLETIVRSLQSRDNLRSLLLQVLDAMVLWVGVERGLLLLRAPDEKLVPRAARNLAREDLRGEQLALSMTLAKRAMETGEAVVATDAFATLGDLHASVHALRLRSVLAVPLVSRGETLGVVYLDDRGRRGAFGPRELSWVRLLASQAAGAIADARDQVLLRRTARRAERAKVKLEVLLAERDAELAATEAELSHARGDETRFRYDAIAGRSEPVRAMLHVVDRVTMSDIPVLVVGESGTGKELIARAMHDNGPRARRRFVSENCAAVPEPLLESTLFGHVRGAFTGASQTRAGLFEVADGGTLFLDEIGEMSLAMQSKLLRVLQDGEVRPVGSERSRHVNVRLVAATHRDLEAMVQKRTFREDLYYRLNVVTIRVPPLRERRSDIPLIVTHLVKKHATGRKVRITKAAMDRIVSFAWPGNVRQLENEVRRALVLCAAGDGEEAVVDVGDLSEELLRVDAAREVGLDLRSRVDALEADLLREALTKTHGNQTKAAEILGLSRFGLQKMMRRLKVAAGRPS